MELSEELIQKLIKESQRGKLIKDVKYISKFLFKI